MKRHVYIIFPLIFLYLLLLSIFKINNGDEGCIITASMRILNGELPYRDFFLHTPPVTYYAIAGAFKIFGSSLIVARALTAVMGILIAMLLYFISRRIMPPAYAIISSLIFMFWGTSQVPNPDFAWFGLLLALVAVYAFTRFLERRSMLSIMTAGIFSGLSFLAKQNLGLCAFATIVLFLIIDEVVKICLKMDASVKKFLKDLLLLAVFFVLPVLMTMYLFYLKGALPYFIKYVFLVGGESGMSRFQVFPYPRIQFPQIIMAAIYCLLLYLAVRRLRKKNMAFPFNALIWAFLSCTIFAILIERALPYFNHFLDYIKTGAIRGFYNFIVFSCVISIILSISALKKRGQRVYEKEMSVIFLSAFGLLYIWAGLFISRDMLHHIYSIPPTFILAGYMFYRISMLIREKAGEAYRFYSRYAIVCPVIFFLVLGFVTNVNDEVFRDNPNEKPLYTMRSFVKLERAKYILTYAEYAKDVEDLVNFIDSETSKNEKIFYTSFNDNEIYFLADRMPASFHHWIHHYTVKTKDQAGIIRDIDANKTKLIFMPKWRYDDRMALSDPANNSSTYEVERYIFDNYRLKKSMGRFVVLERIGTI